MNELSKKISELRKQKGLTQEELAERLGVSAQAVSKWENSISCPDIQLLPKLAEIFNVTIDDLMGVEKKGDVIVVPEEKRKKFDELRLRIKVLSKDGDKVNVNIPMPLVKAAVEMGINLNDVNVGSKTDVLNKVNIDQILMLAEQGVLGNLVEVDSGDGDTVYICVE